MSEGRRYVGKNVVLTGSTKGIGAAVAERLHREGARLVLVARDAAALEAQTDTLPGTTAVVGSVAERETARRAVDACGGRVDVLVNNAGVDLTSDLLDTPEAAVRRTFETNVFGALWMLQACAGAMPAGGAVVNVTSRLASIGVPTMAVYSATKGALLALTRGAAVELAPRGIRVNAVAPGLTATPLMREWIAAQDDPVAFEQRVAATIPQGRFAAPEEVAAAAAFLGSDEAEHITGASLAVDGGYTAA
jgi:NAD(P)-dependent dehydrogenase (short-subunit alcohol dehydrogenase family)